ncbi:hypothetical protein BH18THE2_BH18THE2_12500 [soil metagenome]
MAKDLFLIIFFSVILLTMLSSVSFDINPIARNVYGHIFTPNESASFLSLVDQLRVESELVQMSLINDNLSPAREHANKAAALLTSNVTKEIAEQNQRVADDLSMAINDLQNISSTEQKKSADQLVSNIDAILGEAVATRIEQEQRTNSTIQALAFASLVNNILTEYGNAYAVEYDMTNMSNMALLGNNTSMVMSGMANDGNNSNSNMGSMNMSSSTMMNEDNETNRNYSLVDITDYQSAQALAAKALEIFNVELKPMAPNNTIAFVTNLENGLTQLNSSIRSKASPMDIMMIVHTQIHPNLLEAFNLETEK